MNASHDYQRVYVWEQPVRWFHWINAASITALGVTGWLIAHPPGLLNAGEASGSFWFGTVRFVHFAVGYVFLANFAFRLYWAFAGNDYARELFWVPLFQLAYWQDVWAMIKWYGFASPRPGQYIGHNPLARFAMFFAFLVPCVFMVLTGFAMYAEGQQVGSWQEAAFGWVIPLMGQSQDVHTWHHLGMWAILCFIILHIYAGVREEILGRSSMASTMISGYRTFKD